MKQGTLSVLLLAGCTTMQPAKPALTVSEVWARHHELEGSVIRVRGVIPRCYSLGCELYESKEDKSKWLSIGTSDKFDDEVETYLGKPILVEGRLRGECLHAFADKDTDQTEEVIICTDRASMIMNPKLIGRAH